MPPDVPLPELVSGGVLLPHQVVGVQWMLQREMQGKGGILADEAGTGKTPQMVVVCFTNQLTTLIIVPGQKIAEQWRDVFKDFTGRRPMMLLNSAACKGLPGGTPPGEVVLTTLSMFKSKKQPSLFADTKWQRVVVDEGHLIKNRTTQAYSRTNALDGDIRWIISGTPLQNAADELIALAEWAGFDGLMEPEDIVKEHMLRRSLSDTKHMNDMTLVKKVISVDLRPDSLERRLHDIEYKRMKDENNNNNNLSLEAMGNLRQICAHPRLYLSALERKAMKRNVTEQDDNSDSEFIQSASNASAWQPRREYLPPDVVEVVKDFREFPSAKVMQMCDDIEQNISEKSLVFCQWVLEMYLIAKELRRRNIFSVVYHGSMAQAAKSQIVENFINTPGIKVFIIMIQCGCMGLNLQAASRAYITCPSWNPCQDQQAFKRCFRYGQENPVTIVRIFVKDTIEEWVMQKQGVKFDIQKATMNDENINSDVPDVSSLLDNERLEAKFGNHARLLEKGKRARTCK